MWINVFTGSKEDWAFTTRWSMHFDWSLCSSSRFLLLSLTRSSSTHCVLSILISMLTWSLEPIISAGAIPKREIALPSRSMVHLNWCSLLLLFFICGPWGLWCLLLPLRLLLLLLLLLLIWSCEWALLYLLFLLLMLCAIITPTKTEVALPT